MAISFHLQDINYKISNKLKRKNLIKFLIINEGYKLGNINVIITSDNSLLNINNKFLNHNYFTDVITFDYSIKLDISGDIFISLERIIDNAENFNCSVDNELNRVIIHGILHLLKYNDKEDLDKIVMKNKENQYLKFI